jgi:hypothetical protein
MLSTAVFCRSASVGLVVAAVAVVAAGQQQADPTPNPKAKGKGKGKSAVDPADVPFDVLETVLLRWPKGEILKVDKKDKDGRTVYRFDVLNGDRKSKAEVDGEGRLLKLDETVAPADLPPAAAAGLEKALSDGVRVSEIKRKIDAQGAVQFEVRLDGPAGGGKLAFDGDGKPVEPGKGPVGKGGPPDGIPGKKGKDFTGRGFQEAEWAAWLDGLDRAVMLSPEQRKAADEYLQLARQAAAEYRKVRQDDYRRIAADLAALRKDKSADPTAVAGLEKAAVDLSRPIEEIGRKWRADVLALLTQAQRIRLERATPGKAAP